MFGDLFFEFLTPSALGAVTFSILFHFLSFLVLQMGGVQVFFGHKKQ
jgi:hypothetical protein